MMRTLQFVKRSRLDSLADVFAANPSDAVVLDNEDAVPSAEKAQGRAHIVSALRQAEAAAERRRDWPQIWVRVNSPSSSFWRDDLTALSLHARIRGFVVPKTERGEQLQRLCSHLTLLEARRGMRRNHFALLAIFETAEAIANMVDICRSSPRLRAISIGAADLTARLCCKDDSDVMRHLQNKVVECGRMFNLLPIYGPYLRLNDDAGFADYCRHVKSDGFHGVVTLNSRQTRVALETFDHTSKMDTRTRSKPSKLILSDNLKGQWDLSYINPQRLYMSNTVARALGLKRALAPYPLLTAHIINLFEIDSVLPFRVYNLRQVKAVYFGETLYNSDNQLFNSTGELLMKSSTSRCRSFFPDDEKTRMTKTADGFGLGTWQPLTAGDLYLHTLVKAVYLTDLEQHGEGFLVRTDRVSAGLTVAAVLTNIVLDFGHFITDHVSEAVLLEPAQIGHIIMTASLIRKIHKFGNGLERVDMEQFGLVNVDAEQLSTRQVDAASWRGVFNELLDRKALSQLAALLDVHMVCALRRTVVRRVDAPCATDAPSKV